MAKDQDKINATAEVVDLEEYAKASKRPPHGCIYRFRVDREFFKTRKLELTGREILVIAGKEPEKWLLNQRIKGNVVSIRLDDIVDLTAPGLERFMTLPNDQTEGELRREFALPESDVELLDAAGYNWECVQDNGKQWLIVHRFPVSEGYAQKEVKVAVLIPPGYPSGPLDMVYVSPALALLNGRPIPATQCVERVCVESFQRWSRHYTSLNPWLPDYNVATHLLLARAWFDRELERKVA